MMNYRRNLSDLKNVKKNGFKVFTTFACGGGSTMGYKNAGFDVIGHCDIDKQMIDVYKANHNPKYSFHMGIGEFNDLDDIPEELKNIDILDGSPPCSTFSTAGLREKARGKEKKFREGQAKQVLDDLFFQFLDTVEKLQPKIVIAENVSGMLKGNAKGYVKLIAKSFDQLGYEGQIFLLNGATMGLPQKRERVFFVYHRKDLKLPKLEMNFNDAPIVFDEIDEGDVKSENKVAPCDLQYRHKVKPGKNVGTVHPKGNRFNSIKMHPKKTPNTVASGSELYHRKYPRGLTNREYALIGSFPMDYDYQKASPKYLIGMSVPPLMMYRVACEVRDQWLSKI